MLKSARINGLHNLGQTLATRLLPAFYSQTNPSPFDSILFPALSLSSPYSFVGQGIRNITIKSFEIPDDKVIEVGLQQIYGIGRHRAHNILCEASVENKRAKYLTDREQFILGELVSSYLIDKELMLEKKRAIDRLKQIQCWRGLRHAKGLPCRGQRTHSNARTVKRLSGVRYTPPPATKKGTRTQPKTKKGK